MSYPKVSIELADGRERYAPGELFTCEYQIELAGDQKVNAIETSVLWHTEGKGTEDIGVHFFERREKKMVETEVLKQMHRLSTVLPLSPLSYDGDIVKIRWCIRVRLFLASGEERSEDHVFVVGHAEKE